MMTDAKVISMDGDRPRTPGARSVLLGADRASGERARRRRRTTPLLSAPPAEIEIVDDGPLAPEPVSAAKRAPAKQTQAKRTPVENLPVENVSAENVPVEKVPARKAPTKQASAKQAPARKTPARKTPTKQPSAQKAAARKPAAKKAAAKRTPAERTMAERTPAERTMAERTTTELAPASRGPAKNAAAEKKSTKRPAVKRVAAAPVQPTIEAKPTEVRAPIEPQISSGGEPLPAGGRHSIAKALVAQAGEALLDALISRARPAEIETKVASVLRFLGRRLTGEYELDDFGFDAEFAEAVPLLLLRPLYRHWFRVEVRGIENLPSGSGALIVANHSGAVPIDALMASVAVHEEHPDHRFLRTLGADLLFQTPFLSGIARRSGATLASNPDAERLLSDGHLVGVWPEGFKGIGKPFTERYKLQRFGRGGFVSAALRTGTPIVPCSIVGAEEIYPIIGNVPSLARLLGLPYLPITPFFPLLGPLGAIPLPSKWLIEFGTPVLTNEYEAGAAEDPMLVFDLTDQIRQSIQQTLYSLLVQRRSIFF